MNGCLILITKGIVTVLIIILLKTEVTLVLSQSDTGKCDPVYEDARLYKRNKSKRANVNLSAEIRRNVSQLFSYWTDSALGLSDLTKL